MDDFCWGKSQSIYLSPKPSSFSQPQRTCSRHRSISRRPRPATWAPGSRRPRARSGPRTHRPCRPWPCALEDFMAMCLGGWENKHGMKEAHNQSKWYIYIFIYLVEYMSIKREHRDILAMWWEKLVFRGMTEWDLIGFVHSKQWCQEILMGIEWDIYIYICFLYFSKIGLQQMVVWNQHTWDFMNSDGDTNEI